MHMLRHNIFPACNKTFVLLRFLLYLGGFRFGFAKLGISPRRCRPARVLSFLCWACSRGPGLCHLHSANHIHPFLIQHQKTFPFQPLVISFFCISNTSIFFTSNNPSRQHSSSPRSDSVSLKVGCPRGCMGDN